MAVKKASICPLRPANAVIAPAKSSVFQSRCNLDFCSVKADSAMPDSSASTNCVASGHAAIGNAVALLFDPDNVGGATIGDDQVDPVFGTEKRRQCRYPTSQTHQIVLAQRKHRGNQIVPHAAIAQMNFQTLAEKIQQLRRSAGRRSGSLPSESRHSARAPRKAIGGATSASSFSRISRITPRRRGAARTGPSSQWAFPRR